MKRKLAETKAVSDEQESSTKAKKKKKKQKKEFEVDDLVEDNTLEVDIKVEDEEIECTSEETNKKKKKKKKHADTNDESLAEYLDCVLETGDDTDAQTFDNPNGIVKDMWPKEKILTLITRIMESVPDNDNLKYSSRMLKLDWAAISFDVYNATDCQSMWKNVQERTRCYRLLKEVAHDAKEAIQLSSSAFYHNMVKEKHPDMPVKPLSSFMLFYMDVKDVISQQNPGIGCPELAKKVSELWKTLPTKKTEKYSKKACTLKDEYKFKLEEFYKKHPEFIEEKKKKTKSNADSLGFEKPKSAFQLYYQHCRENAEKKETKIPPLQVLEKAKENWKKMAEDKKVMWIEEAQREEETYLDSLKRYKLEHPGSDIPILKTQITKNDRHILENISGRPKKPPSNAYSLYSQMMLQSNSLKKLPSKERLTEISKRWKNLDQLEKDRYTKELHQMQEDYKKQYNEFVLSLPPEEQEKELERNRTKRKKGPVKSFLSEPESPPLNVLDFFKTKHQDEWKKKTKNVNVDELAKKKWNALTKPARQDYVKELKNLNDKYVDEYAKFLQQCPPDQFKQYFIKITDHNKQVDNLIKKEPTTADSDDE